MDKKWTWETIADTLINEFKQDIYKKGDKMPSENKMAVRFGVTRIEIRKAYEKLKELGYVYSMQGYGSFFSGKREKIRLFMNDKSFSHKMSSLNLPLETHNIDCQKIREDSLIHTMLKVPSTENIYKITRLRLMNQEPIAIHISYLPENLFPSLSKEASHITSVYDYMNTYGHTDLFCDNSQLTVSSLSKKERNLLGIQGYASSLVLTCRCISRPTNTVVEIAKTIYRSDKFIFELP